MNLWKEITKLALIGTERGQLSDEAKVELERYGINTAADPAEVVLKASALLSKISVQAISRKRIQSHCLFLRFLKHKIYAAPNL